jgi:hypothetical protein
MISYTRIADRNALVVRVDRKRVGVIRRAPEGGFHFCTTGGHCGETFATIVEVQASLEGDNA